MATERQSPDAILASTSLSGAVTDIDDDPDSPDGNWLTAPGNNNNTDVRVSFPTPSGNPTTGSGLQQFKIWVRKTNHSTDPTVAIELWENGTLLGVLTSGVGVSSTTGQLVSVNWDAVNLVTANGSLVECKVIGSVGSGSPSNRASLEVGAIEWNVDYTTATPTRGRTSFAELEVPQIATRGRVSFSELEAPTALTRGRISFSELETPAIPTRGYLSFAEADFPEPGDTGNISFAEFEVPQIATRGRVSFSEVEIPTVLNRGRISQSELEIPQLLTRGRVSHSELEVPLIATKGFVGFAELEVPLAPTRGLISFADMVINEESGDANFSAMTGMSGIDGGVINVY